MFITTGQSFVWSAHDDGTPASHENSGERIKMGETTTNAPNNSQTTVREPSIVVLIQAAIAARGGPDTGDCPPLYDAIDPDALDTLFAPLHRESERHGKVMFEYCGYDVTVHADRTIELESIDAESG
jgi:Halobacterial output domain 1